MGLATREELKQAFSERGISVAEWARSRGYDAQQVYAVLSGRSQGLRGSAHEIAVALRLKAPPTALYSQLDLPISDGGRTDTQNTTVVRPLPGAGTEVKRIGK
ncbi:MAG: DNA-binding protein [Chromatiales bacterium]|nr:DNA-binding protein [Chromatiales bacterium]